MNNESFPENNSSGQGISAIGPQLKKAREALHLSIMDVARQLRLTNERIEALEKDSYENMPGLTFIKGYLRAYARLVNLPADKMIQDFECLNPAPETKSSMLSSYAQPVLLSNKSMRWIIYLIGIGLLILVVIWWNSLPNGEPASLNPVDLKHATAKNAPPPAGALTNATSANSVNVPNKNPVNLTANMQPGAAAQGETGNTAVNAGDTSHNTAATSQNDQGSTSPASPSGASPASTEPSSAQAAGENATPVIEDASDELKPHKRSSRSHHRPQFDEPFDDE